MALRRETFLFGEITICRSGDLDRRDVDTLVQVSTVLEAMRSPGRSGSVIRLFDAIRGTPRYAPPTSVDLAYALRTIERALRAGDWVALRGVRRGATYTLASQPQETSLGPSEPAPTPTRTWFEATLVDAAGTVIDGVSVTWSFGGGARSSVTNAAGMTRFEDDGGRTIATLRLGDAEAAREILQSRDVAADTTSPEEALVWDLSKDAGAATISSETPTTVVLIMPSETWVGIELVNADGAPVVGQPYRITTDRGDTFEGVLDDSGKARCAISESAAWTVVFPGLDESVAGDEASS